MFKISIENPITSEESDLNLLFYGSFLPIPNKDLFKLNSMTKDATQMLTSNQRASTDEFVLVEHDQQISDSYPGQIIAFELPKSEQKAESSNANSNNNINEEGELKDEEDIVEIETDEKMQISETNKLSENINLNKDRSSNDCVLLTVFNSSNQSIKVDLINL